MKSFCTSYTQKIPEVFYPFQKHQSIGNHHLMYYGERNVGLCPTTKYPIPSHGCKQIWKDHKRPHHFGQSNVRDHQSKIWLCCFCILMRLCLCGPSPHNHICLLLESPVWWWLKPHGWAHHHWSHMIIWLHTAYRIQTEASKNVKQVNFISSLKDVIFLSVRDCFHLYIYLSIYLILSYLFSSNLFLSN